MFAISIAKSPLDEHQETISAIDVHLIEPLFDAVPFAPYFVKNTEGAFVSVNTAMAELCGERDRAGVIGRKATDFFDAESCARMEGVEAHVLRTGQPMRHAFIRCARPSGASAWLLLNCWPIRAKEANDRLLGVAGVGRTLEDSERRRHMYERVAAAVNVISANVGASIRITDLARDAGVSLSQLERDFAEFFGLPPRRYLARARLNAAMDMLRGSATIAEVAHACGYPDQSAFTRRFQISVGVTPSEFRRAALAETKTLQRA